MNIWGAMIMIAVLAALIVWRTRKPQVIEVDVTRIDELGCKIDGEGDSPEFYVAGAPIYMEHNITSVLENGKARPVEGTMRVEFISDIEIPIVNRDMAPFVVPPEIKPKPESPKAASLSMGGLGIDLSKINNEDPLTRAHFLSILPEDLRRKALEG